jgi:uncharacterized protein
VPLVMRRLFFGPSGLRAGWGLFVFVVLVFCFTGFANLAFRRLAPAAGRDVQFLVSEVEDFLVFLLASWIMGLIEHRTVSDYGLPWRSMFRLRFWQGMVIGFASITGLLVVMRAAGLFHFEGLDLHGADIAKWGAIYALVFLLVALREEFRARGYALFTLSRGIGFWPAALLSSAYFGYSHIGNSGEDWIGLVNAGVFGLLLCFLLRRTGNLWLPIGFHLAFDWGETYFYGVPDSGQVAPGHLLRSSFSGPAWLSGGSVGPEGSVLCTVMIVALWLICGAGLRKSKYPGS